MARTFFSTLVVMAALAIPAATQADCMGPYPPSMVKTFNESCAKNQDMALFCSCIMEGIQRNIPLADFIEISNTTGINTDPRFLKVSQQCAQKNSGNPAPNNPSSTPSPNTSSAPPITGTVVNGGGIRSSR